MNQYYSRVIYFLDRFFFHPTSSQTLSFFRIAISIFCIVQIYSIYPDLLNIFGEQGYIRRDMQEIFLADYVPRIHWLNDYFHSSSFSEVDILFTLSYCYIGVLVLMGIGFLSNFFAGISLLIHLMFFGSGELFMYGADYLTTSCLFYCFIMPTGNKYSIDKVIWRNKKSTSMKNTYAIRLLQIHLCFIYFFGGFSKMLGTQWWNGEAIWRTIMIPSFQQYDLSWVAFFPYVSILFGWFVLLLEFGYPLFISSKKTRLLWLLSIVGMHIGIGVFMGLSQFAAIMIIMNITAFGGEYIDKIFYWINLFSIRSKY